MSFGRATRLTRLASPPCLILADQQAYGMALALHRLAFCIAVLLSAVYYLELLATEGDVKRLSSDSPERCERFGFQTASFSLLKVNLNSFSLNSTSYVI